MAIDTRNKRASAIGVSLPWRGLFPLPDAVISVDDRVLLGGYYSGIIPAPPVLKVELRRKVNLRGEVPSASLLGQRRKINISGN